MQPTATRTTANQRLNLIITIQLKTKLCANLREYFRFDPTRPLINDEKGDVVLSHLASNLPQNTLSRRGPTQKLMGLFENNH